MERGDERPQQSRARDGHAQVGYEWQLPWADRCGYDADLSPAGSVARLLRSHDRSGESDAGVRDQWTRLPRQPLTAFKNRRGEPNQEFASLRVHRFLRWMAGTVPG